MVRVRLPRSLRNQFDSMDFVQAVWKSVFTGKADDVGAVRRRRPVPRLPGRGGPEQGLRGAPPADPDQEVRPRPRGAALRPQGGARRPPRGRGDRPDAQRERPGRRPPRPADPGAGPPRRSQIVELRRQGLTFEEIAERLGISERSVRRVIEAIRERMEARQWR